MKYYVRKSFEDAESQIAEYKVLSAARKRADQNEGYYVFDEDGNKYSDELEAISEPVVIEEISEPIEIEIADDNCSEDKVSELMDSNNIEEVTDVIEDKKIEEKPAEIVIVKKKDIRNVAEEFSRRKSKLY